MSNLRARYSDLELSSPLAPSTGEALMYIKSSRNKGGVIDPCQGTLWLRRVTTDRC